MMKNVIKTKSDSKTFTSMGPWPIYMKLALLTFYTPYWRKICRMLCKARRIYGPTLKGDNDQRLEKYLRAAIKDTKMPDLIKWTLCECIEAEFQIKM